MLSKFNRLKSYILGPCHIKIEKNMKEIIFLAGSGRSGTTWISEIINYKNEYRYIFEPMHNHKVKIFNEFKYRQYLRSDNQDNTFFKPINKLFRGKIRSKWTDSFNKKLIYNKILIKDIRANLLLKWIKKNYPKVKIVLILRNPCAVANSKIKLKWNSDLDVLLGQKELLDDFLFPFVKYINSTKDIFEKHVFMWCIENYIPLKQFKKNEIYIVRYEDFCLKPEQEVNNLFLFLDKKYNKKILKTIKIPSALSRKDSPIIFNDDLINGWKKNINKNQIKKAKHILELFGLEKIYKL